MQRPAILALVGITVASLAAGVLVSNALTGADGEQRLPAVRAAAPVLGPRDAQPGPSAPGAGAPSPGDTTSSGGGSGGGGSGGGGSGGGSAVPVSDPEGVVEPYVGGGSSGSTTLPDAVRVVDPCAGGPPCDDPGVGSTVLGIFAAPPPEITTVFTGIAECHLSSDDPFVLGTPYQIVSTFPGDFVITLTNSRVPDEVRTGRASTLASETAREETARPVGDRYAGAGYRTCGGITLPNRTTDWDVLVEGTSASGQTATFSRHFLQVASGGRPPVQIDTPSIPNEDRLRVVAPASSRGGVVMRYERADGVTGAACRSSEAGLFADTAVSPLADSVPVPPEELAAAGYPYDESFDRRATRVFRFAPSASVGGRVVGGDYDICLWWYDAHTTQITEREAYRVQVPNRYAIDFRVAAAHFIPHRIPSEFEVSTFGGTCRLVLAGRRVVADVEYGAGVEAHNVGSPGGCLHSNGLEQVPGSALAFPSLDPLLRVTITGAPTPVEAYLRLPLSSCPGDGGACAGGDFTEDYVIDLGSHDAGLCGSGFGGGCTPPTESNGTITIQVHFQDQGVATGVRSWSVGPAVAP